MTEKKTLGIIAVIFIVIVVIAVVIMNLPSAQLPDKSLPTPIVILDVKFAIIPDTLHYKEFTVETDGILHIELSCNYEDGNLLWYIMKCDALTFVNRGEGEFYDLTYKRNIQGQNPISDIVEIAAGTYTFVYVQTVGGIGEQITPVKIVFEPAQ